MGRSYKIHFDQKKKSSGGSKLKGVMETVNKEEIDWELRPGGMVVQRREDGVHASSPTITIKVAHGLYQYEVNVPAQTTFGELKLELAQKTGLEPKEQRLLFRGKEKEDDEWLHMVGVKDMSKVVLLEDPASKEKKLEEMKKNKETSKSCEAVAKIRTEVNKLSEKVEALKESMHVGTKIANNDFVVLTELFMAQLLKLDGVEAEGEAKVQRRNEVHRVQKYLETVDVLKAQNSNPFSISNSVRMTTNWESFDSDRGTRTAPSTGSSSTKVTKDWEQFD